MKLYYPVCIYPEKEGGFSAIVPDLKGCVTEGETIAEVFEMATDAASGWVLDELEDGKHPPKASDISEVHASEYPNGFTAMLILDMERYSEKYGNQSVRKNCTLPSWLNTQAELAGVNFSQVLQEALVEKLGLS